MENEQNKKPWYKKWWGVVIIVLTWWISLLVIAAYFIWLKTSWQRSVKIGATAALIIVWIAIPLIMPSQEPVAQQVSTSPTSAAKKPAIAEPAPQATSQPIASASGPVSKIENTIKAIGNFEVTVWTAGKNLADDKSKPPYEIIVNTSAKDIDGCFDAKNKSYRVMEAVYSNNDIRRTVARVKFNAWGQLQASLGEKDIGDHWNGSGPSNFWKVLLQVKPYEDETGPLNLRTYGVRLNADCS